MRNLSAVLRHFPGQNILTIGDVILDRYWWGEASRLSPEAPVPVVRKQRSTVRPGGAANTAANLAALGASPHLVGVVGTDREAMELQGALLECDVPVDFLISESARPTTTKTRVIASHQQIVRVDEEDTGAMPAEAESRAREMIAGRLELTTAVVVSDYAKGFLTPSLLNFVIDAAARSSKRVFVDPKGADGMTMFADSRPVEYLASAPRQVFDVTGAGDTVLAILSLAISAGASYRDAMELATEAAAIAISTMGTATVRLHQLESALHDRMQADAGAIR